MGIFDNVSSVVINDKEVQSIKIGDSVLYEAEPVSPVVLLVLVINDTHFESYTNSPFVYTGALTIGYNSPEGEPYDGGKINHTHESSEWGCSITGRIREITDTAFKNAPIGEINGVTGITSLGDNCFENNQSLHALDLGTTLVSIGDYCFKDCTNIMNITIPDSVTSIGEGAFSGCSRLSSITFNSSTPPTLGVDAFTGISNSATIYVPTGSLSDYTSAPNYPSTSDVNYEEI